MTTLRGASRADLVDPDAIVAALRAEGHTVGRVRRRVLEVVQRQEAAFTAEQLAGELPDVHVSTVYRTLGLLEEIGVVQHIHLSHGPAVYERTAVQGTMRHLVCEVCGRHLEVPSEVFAAASRTLRRDYDFVLDGVHFAIVGRCVECANSDPHRHPAP